MKIQRSLSAIISLLLALSLVSLGNIVVAQDDDQEQSRFANAQTTKVKALSAATAKKLEPARNFLAPDPNLNPAPKPDPRAAIRALEKIRTNDLPGHERAEIWNLYGYSYFLLEDEIKALEFYERVVNEPEANGPLRNRTLKTVGQLYIVQENWSQALKFYKQWAALQLIIGPDDHALFSQIYYNLDDLNNSLSSIETAIAVREDKGAIGKENWYAIQRSIYFTRGDYRKVISILKKLIVNYPNVKYWRELGGMYSELEDGKKQMASFAVAYVQNGLTSESQIVGLAYLYIGADAPYKGAEILVDAMNDDLVEKTEKNLQLVGSAYFQANEYTKALPYMEQAASKSKDGESHGRLAGVYLDLERYDESIRAGREALRRGGLKQKHLVQLGLGTALFNTKQYDEAIRVMRQVKGEGEDSAKDWIKYINSEKKREKQLREAGIDLDKILSANN